LYTSRYSFPINRAYIADVERAGKIKTFDRVAGRRQEKKRRRQATPPAAAAVCNQPEMSALERGDLREALPNYLPI
jgi:hypothetical protein